MGCGLIGSSPHTRGAHLRRHKGEKAAWIIPAYAGSTRGFLPRPTLPQDHPRIRGEHAALASQAHSIAGSSPHTRGAPRRRQRYRRHSGIIPAYAGSTARRRYPAIPPTDHPRIRGEHPRAPVTMVHGAGSSPHTRGALGLRLRVAIGDRIIPAYAGSTITRAGRLRPPRDHPRIRGEHRPDDQVGAHDAGIIPAYAGSTSSAIISSRVREDHPRIRGEHVIFRDDQASSKGSSPHTRGAQAVLDETYGASRIIPAYAGSTYR